MMRNTLTPARQLLIIVGILCLIGLVTLYSAAYQRQLQSGKNFLLSQILWLALGGALMVVISRVNYHSFLSVAYLLYGVQLILLILVLVAGKTVLGAQRWISVGGMFSVQPSEFSKMFMILVLARFISDRPQCLQSMRGLSRPLLLTLIPALLIFKQPDLGTALVFVPIMLALFWVGNIKRAYMFSGIAAALALIPLGLKMLKDYQKDRLLVFINPDVDPLGAGYTITQSKVAIGSGMLAGKGWMAGTQNQLNFLPERHTDFIFSVIGEEWGFIGTLCVVVLFLLLIRQGYYIASLTHDRSGKLLATGVTTMVALHVIINIGMTIGLMPVVGMPLPFISYGGSALISNMLAIGFLLNVYHHRTMF